MKRFGLVFALIVAASIVFAGCESMSTQGASLKVAMLIPGHIDDNGFMEAGYNGLLEIEKELGAEIVYTDRIKPEKELLEAAIRELADQNPDMVIAHGGQNSEAMALVAPEYPQIKFVVIQGNVTGDNLSSYEVLQEESAWLAGAAAGLLTESGIVGHISGIRVRPGLKGRGAFYNGLIHTNPQARYLTTFAGDQDDAELAYSVAMREIDAGADIIFTMLNAGRVGAIKAMEERNIRQFGNVKWDDTSPVMIGSAVANVSMAALLAASDLQAGKWEGGKLVTIGLDNEDAVRLALADDVSQEVKDAVEELRQQIIAGEIEVSVEYEGEEFSPSE